MSPMSSTSTLGLVLILTAAASLTTSLIIGYAALWGVAPGLIALGVTLMAASRKRRT